MATVQDVIDRARLLLKDGESPLTDVRHADEELFKWVADALSSLIDIRPEAGAKMVTLELVDGAKQTLPLSVTLLNVTENLNGAPINKVDRYVLDTADPGWQQQKPGKVVLEYTYRDTAPRVFFVNPPAKAGMRVRAEVAAIPAVVSLDDQIVVSDRYLPALANYVCYRMHMVDAEHAANLQLANTYFAQFAGSLGVSIKSAARVSAKATHDGR